MLKKVAGPWVCSNNIIKLQNQLPGKLQNHNAACTQKHKHFDYVNKELKQVQEKDL